MKLFQNDFRRSHIMQGDHFLHHIKFPEFSPTFSQTILEFPDFSRLVVTRGI